MCARRREHGEHVDNHQQEILAFFYDQGYIKKIDEQTVADHLYLPDVPDPELMIRTSGELRLSNFMLWQLSYSEFYITDTYWPDFREEHFFRALEAYNARDRRYGEVRSKGCANG